MDRRVAPQVEGAVVKDRDRAAGSQQDFEDEWDEALATDESRFWVYPSLDSDRQPDLFEWIKVEQIQAALKQADITEGRILEYGCGAAGISLYLARRGLEAHLCDRSTKALRVAERNRRRNALRASISSSVAGDAMELPYRSNAFDSVMSFGLLEHFELKPLHELLAETVRVLRPGGLFVADIVPGLGRFNARTVGTVASYLGSVLAHAARCRWAEIPTLYSAYFDQYFENTYDERRWTEILRQHDLDHVRVAVCRPFPSLALSGSAERAYTALIRRFMGFHQRFDGANTCLSRRWGWMYLATGVKKGYSV